LAVVLALSASQAMAQPGWYSGGPAGIPPRQVPAIVRSTGLTPVTPPARVGPNYVVHAIDRNGETVRVVIDADFGDIVRIRPLGRSAVAPGPWNRWGSPRPYPRYGDLSDELGVRQWWNTAPPRPNRNIPVARAPIGPEGPPPPPRPRTDPPIANGAPIDPADLPAPAAGVGAPPEAALPPPPPVNTARTGPDGPPPAIAARPDERANRPAAPTPQAAKPHTAAVAPQGAPLPKPKPSAEQMAVRGNGTAPAAAKPSPRVVLPGGPAAKGEKPAAAVATAPAASAPAPAAAATGTTPPAETPSAPAAAATSATPPMPPMQTLE
jgi:hypothetical protein